VTSRISGSQALAFSMALAVGSFAVLAIGANLLAAMLSLAGLVFYVVVYTLFLKRRTTHNIVIGGAAGCFPPLVGWAAVTGDLHGALAWYLFAIIFVWTPAHFWALALLIKDDYTHVGIPMLPSVVGDRVTVVQITIYALITAGVSLLPLVQSLVGWVYVAAAVALNVLLIARSLKLLRNSDRANARSMYLYSMAYLALLFLALAIDRSVLA
jgi:heme o synthase